MLGCRKQPLEFPFAPLIDELCRTLSHALSYHLLSKIRRLCSTLQNFSEFTRQRTYWACWGPKCDAISTSWHLDPIVSSFCTTDIQWCSHCTVAIGLGVTSPHARQVIHWGPPWDSEEYVQHRVCSRRKFACALLFVQPSDFSRIKHHRHLQYCENTTTCRRKLLLHHYDEVSFTKDCKGWKGCDACAICC